MAQIRDALQGQPHACVPLGWNPVPAGGYYYPGYSTSYQKPGVWLPPLWLGVIYDDQRNDADVRASYDVINALISVGMVRVERRSHATFYHLTMNAVPYYFNSNNYGEDPDGIPMLCYSTIVPTKILSTSAVVGGSFKATFQWRPSPPAGWAATTFFRTHSIILPPLQETAIATFRKYPWGWSMHSLSTSAPMLGRPVDASVWPMQRK
jgi:hypothetical protein